MPPNIPKRGPPVDWNRIMYGTAWKEERTTDLVVAAVLAGFRGIETASQTRFYREKLVGKAVAELESKHSIPRSELFIQTKFSPPNSQDLDGYLPYDIKAPLADKVRQSVENSIKDLGSPPDSVVLHREMETIDETLEVLMVLRDLRKEGKITQMTGISNAYDADRLATMVLHEPELIQVISNRWHEANAWDHQIMATVSENGPRKSGYLRHKTDVMYQGFWTLTGSPVLTESEPLCALAHKKGITPQQAIYGLLQSWGGVPLCGACTEQHYREALEVKGWEWHRDDGEEVRMWMRAHAASLPPPPPV